jgi:hypothetical protein
MEPDEADRRKKEALREAREIEARLMAREEAMLAQRERETAEFVTRMRRDSRERPVHEARLPAGERDPIRKRPWWVFWQR